MRRAAAIFIVVVVILFGAITLLKRQASGSGDREDAEAVTLAERERVQRFWRLYRRATDHRIAGRTEEAAAAYASALELNDRHEDALYYMGNMHFELGEFPKAQRAWQRLIQVNTSSARAHSRLGDLYFCLEQEELFDVAAAEAEFRRALEINKEETGSLLRLGQIALARGNLTDALSYFDAVTGSNYTSVDAHFLKGYIAWKRRDQETASALLAQALQYAHPDEPIGEVPGEGDTKAGSSPMLSTARNCRTFETQVDDLPKLDDANLPREVNQRYRRLDAVLAQARSRIPS